MFAADSVEHPNYSLAQALIARGADVNAAEDEGKGVLMRAGKVEWPNKRVGECLIPCGAHLDARNKQGQSVLMLAEKQHSSDSKEIVRILKQAKVQNAQRTPHIGKAQ